MIERQAKDKMLEMIEKFPIVAFTGPRQSGKTTLCKEIFPDYRYVSLENPDNLLFAQSDPRGFLKIYDKHVVIDEVQKAPELFSYLQQIVDDAGIDGQFVLSGSQNFLLLERITQSLAGRVYLMELLPLTQDEIKTVKNQTCYEAIVNGAYPRLFDKNIAPKDFYPSYIHTYIERDVRSINNVQDLSLFRRFMKLLAHRIGQLLNINSLSKELGVDYKTVQRWLSVLEASYIAFRLQPWDKNFAKRLVKTPKLYFYDVGVASYFLGIENQEELFTSKYKGALFENFGILELLKKYKNKGESSDFYFWRDSNGNEIDLVIERGKKVKFVEMKASETVKKEYLNALHFLDNKDNSLSLKHYLLNTSDSSQERSNESIVSWKNAGEI